METKPAQNIQDTFLNTARKERTNITIYLLERSQAHGPHPLLRQVFRRARH